MGQICARPPPRLYSPNLNMGAFPIQRSLPRQILDHSDHQRQKTDHRRHSPRKAPTPKRRILLALLFPRSASFIRKYQISKTTTKSTSQRNQIHSKKRKSNLLPRRSTSPKNHKTLPALPLYPIWLSARRYPDSRPKPPKGKNSQTNEIQRPLQHPPLWQKRS